MEKVILRFLCLSLFLLSTNSFAQGGNNFSGHVRCNDFPMSGVTAYLTNAQGVVVNTAVTNNGGHYLFQNIAPGDYSITFSTDQPAGGVTLSDAYLVMMRILNLVTFTPIQELSADVDGSGTITWNDYSLILVGYLNEGEPFPIGPWVFEEGPHFTIPYGSRDGFTTRGVSSGDVNGSLVPDPKISPIFVENPVQSLTTGPSDPVEFSVTSAGNLEIAGMHLVLKIPEGLSVLNVESAISSAKISILNEQVRVTWIDQNLLPANISEGTPLLVIKTQATGLSSDEVDYRLKLSDESLFINAAGEMITGVNLILPTIHVTALQDMTQKVYPNPFMEYTNVNYFLPADGHVIISLFDQMGRLIMELVNSEVTAGEQRVTIDGNDLMPGIYHYSITYIGIDKLINTGTIIKSK